MKPFVLGVIVGLFVIYKLRTRKVLSKEKRTQLKMSYGGIGIILFSLLLV